MDAIIENFVINQHLSTTFGNLCSQLIAHVIFKLEFKSTEDPSIEDLRKAGMYYHQNFLELKTMMASRKQRIGLWNPWKEGSIIVRLSVALVNSFNFCIFAYLFLR